jgi:hypothetical protein
MYVVYRTQATSGGNESHDAQCATALGRTLGAARRDASSPRTSPLLSHVDATILFIIIVKLIDYSSVASLASSNLLGLRLGLASCPLAKPLQLPLPQRRLQW